MSDLTVVSSARHSGAYSDPAAASAGKGAPRRKLVLALMLAAGMILSGCGLFSGDDDDDEKIEGERIPVLGLDDTLSEDPALAGVPIVLPPPVANESWPVPGGSVSHALHHLAANGTFNRVWSISAGRGSSQSTRLTATPIVADGRVYVLDARTHVSAFNARTGAKLWEANLTPKGEDPEVGFGGGVAYGEGNIYVTTGFGFTAALDAASGAEVWRQNLRQPFHLAPTYADGRVFVTTFDNQLYALDARDGSVIWDHQAIAEVAGILGDTSPAISGDVIVAPFSSGELFAIRVQNGRVVWTDSLVRRGRMTSLSTLNDIEGRPVIDQGRVIAASHSGRLVSIDLRSGQRVWTKEIASIQMPWAAGDFIFLVTVDAELLCISRRDGGIRWITPLQRYEDMDDKEDPIIWTGPVLAGGRLVLGSSHGEMVTVVPETGEVASRHKLPAGTFITPVVANGMIYVLTDEAELVAFE